MTFAVPAGLGQWRAVATIRSGSRQSRMANCEANARRVHWR
jgi:hypothetical protein